MPPSPRPSRAPADRVPVIEIRFTALPEHVRTARLVAAAVARRAGIDSPLLDEIRLAVGEACSRAVAAHRRVAPDVPVVVTVADERDSFLVTVIDSGPPNGAEDTPHADDPFAVVAARAGDTGEPPGDTATDVLPSGFGLAVIAGLVDDLDVTREPTGTVVRMTWKTAGSGAAASVP
jgi:anti-sigma regulatory factor (Ser/Thr protein kinase)